MNDRIIGLFNEIRHDPDALFELRQLLFGLMIVVGVFYAFNTLYVEKRQKEQKKLVAQEQQLEATLANGTVEALTAGQLTKLGKQKTDLEEKLELLSFKEQMFREEYTAGKNDQAFTNVIFTLLPRAPVDIEGELEKMNVLEKRSYEYFELLPVAINGGGDFAEILSYLQYIEGRPEVGAIESLTMQLSETDVFSQNAPVDFELVVGQVRLY